MPATMILYGVTIVTSAFLLFLVQPIVAKQILPWFGGTASVWTVCVVFFQAMLLAGYAYAHGITRCRPRTQACLHLILLAASLASLPIIASTGWQPHTASDPTWRIVGLLFATVGLPYFLLSSTGPLVQSWVARDRTAALRPASVYRLFAWSNGGSLVGLLCYPFVIEPFVTLQVQSWGWSAGYVCFATACAACAWRSARGSAHEPTSRELVGDEADAEATVAPSMRRMLWWLACAALGSTLLLAATNHVTQNIASIPLLWVLPLALYLVSFVVVFEGRGGSGWYVRRWWRAPVLAAAITMAWAMSAKRGVLNLYVGLPIFCVGLFLACVFCHGELARSKPAPIHLTRFYLCLAAGGTVGGLFVALVAPNLFTYDWEMPIAIVGVAALALLTSDERRLWGLVGGALLGLVAAVCILLAGGGTMLATLRAALPGSGSTATIIVLVGLAAMIFVVATWRSLPFAVVTAALICSVVYADRYYRFMSQDTLVATRNFYGALRVRQLGVGEERRRDLMHGVILHGNQYLAADKRRKPTTYYGPGSGIALALNQLRGGDEPIDVAMIGLGTGTLTAWGRAGDRYHVYDINPAIVDIARRDFTYVADSRANVAIVMGDARLSMEREVAAGNALPYDVIAVDAFSSDAIPVHLITREALQVYVDHLKPDGVVAFHVSNRYLRLAPVVQQIANDAGMRAIDVVDDPVDDDDASSEWVLVTRNQAFLDNPVVHHAGSAIQPIAGLAMWTDQFNNLFKILK